MRFRSSLLFAALPAALLACQQPQAEEPAAPAPAPEAVAAEPAAPAAPKAPVPLETYFQIERVGGSTFSHDEALVAYVSDEGGRLDVWVQPVAGGQARQLTHVTGFVHSLEFSPTEDVLMYEADDKGDELPHLFLTDSKGTTPRDLVADLPEGARTRFVEWAEDGKTFLYLSSRRDPKYMDLCEYTLATGETEVLWESSGKLAFSKASRDQRRFVVEETISDKDSNLYLLERGRKAPALLTKHEGDVLYWAATFSPDGTTLYYTSDEGREFAALYAMDLAKRRSEQVLAVEWDVEDAGFSKGWRYFYVLVNEDGTPKLTLTEGGPGGKPVALPEMPGKGALVPFRFSKSDRYLGAKLTTDTAPQTLLVADLAEGKVSKLVEVLPAALRGRPMVAGESVQVPSFDGRKVQGFLYRPKGGGPFPAVIDVHGGPTWQSKRRFEPMRQYLVSKGYVVFVPNVRGSTGYGKSFTQLDNMDLGGGPLKDVVACKEWLVANAGVDSKRVVVMGGSYGGYMALAAAAFTPGTFAAQVDYFGVSDLKSLVESFPAYWAAYATFIYEKFGDPKNPAHAAYQHDRSPLHFASKIVTPLLVVQGDHDARVKKDQSDRIVASLRERGVPVHYLVIEGEGHGFSGTANRLRAYQATDRFLDRYLFGDMRVRVLDEEAPVPAEARREVAPR